MIVHPKAPVATATAALPARAGSSRESDLRRLEAVATLRDLILRILLRESATLALEDWCAEHGFGGRVTAEVQPGRGQPAPACVRDDLKVATSELIRYRRVRLCCGGRLLVEADNWYVPGRLPANVVEVLERSRTPFGRAVQHLGARRRTLSGRLLFGPFDPGGPSAESGAIDAASGDAQGGSGSAHALTPPEDLYEVQALLTLPSGEPLSEVVETYKRGVLPFARPGVSREFLFPADEPEARSAHPRRPGVTTL